MSSDPGRSTGLALEQRALVLARMLDSHLFEQVAEATRSLGTELESLQLRYHRRGVKAWFGGADRPTREHFEAQMLARRHVDGTDGVAVEIGFHAEHKDLGANEAIIARLLGSEKTWRRTLGSEAQVGEFYGASNWRRISEVWLEPDLDDPEFAFEVAARLVDYLHALEPVLSEHGSTA